MIFLAWMFYFPNSHHHPVPLNVVSCQYSSPGSEEGEKKKKGKAETNSYYQKGKGIILRRIIISYDNHSLPSNHHLSCASASKDSALPFAPRHQHARERDQLNFLSFCDLTALISLFPNEQASPFLKALSNKTSSSQQVWHPYTWPYPESFLFLTLSS